MIRDAVWGDLPTLVALVGEFFSHGELEGTGLEVDAGSVEDFCINLLENGGRVLLVDEIDGEIRGAIAGWVAPWMFNKNVRALTEFGWFVPERYRGDAAIAGRLFRSFVKSGKALGATVIHISSNVRAEHPRVHEFYHRLGFRVTDCNYVGRI